MERFFDLFPERQMASDLFTIVEDIRIDSRVTREYGGIRRASRRVQERELDRRPDVRSLPLREAFIENLVRASLDGERTMVWPKPLMPLLARSHQRPARASATEGATVEDAAEATLLALRDRREDAQPAAGDAGGHGLGRASTEEDAAG